MDTGGTPAKKRVAKKATRKQAAKKTAVKQTAPKKQTAVKRANKKKVKAKKTVKKAATVKSTPTLQPPKSTTTRVTKKDSLIDTMAQSKNGQPRVGTTCQPVDKKPKDMDGPLECQTLPQSLTIKVKKLIPSQERVHLVMEQTARVSGIALVAAGALMTMHFTQLALGNTSQVAYVLDGTLDTDEQVYPAPEIEAKIDQEGWLTVYAYTAETDNVTLDIYATDQSKKIADKTMQPGANGFEYRTDVRLWPPGTYSIVATAAYPGTAVSGDSTVEVEERNWPYQYMLTVMSHQLLFTEWFVKSDAYGHCNEFMRSNPTLSVRCVWQDQEIAQFAGNGEPEASSYELPPDWNDATSIVYPLSVSSHNDVTDSSADPTASTSTGVFTESGLPSSSDESDQTEETSEDDLADSQALLDDQVEEKDDVDVSEIADTEVQSAEEEVEFYIPDTDAESDTSEPEVLPELMLDLSNDELSGTKALTARIESASRVDFFVRGANTAKAWFVGTGRQVYPGVWRFLFDTTNTPNGSYELFATAGTVYGKITSDITAVKIINEITQAPTEAQAQYIDDVKALNSEIEEINKTSTETAENQAVIDDVQRTNQLIDSGTAADSTPTIEEETSDASDEAAADVALRTFTEQYQSEIDVELRRLAMAYRNDDADAIADVRADIQNLLVTIAAGELPTRIADGLDERLRNKVDTIVLEYTIAIDDTDQLIAERNQTDVLEDSDNDGVTDFDEITLYKTDPYRGDTDNDGFTDGAEVLGGYDPLSSEPEAVMRYESPKERGVIREDIFVIDRVTPVKRLSEVVDSDGLSLTEESVPTFDEATMATDSDSVSVLIEGRALPNSFVTLYVFSTPVVVTVKTDNDGSWRYEFDHELEDGEHEVFIGVTDNAGRLVAKSQPFRFVKEAQAVTPLEAASAGGVVTTDESGTFSSMYLLYALVSVSLVAIGLVLILLGADLRRRRPELLLPSNDTAVA